MRTKHKWLCELLNHKNMFFVFFSITMVAKGFQRENLNKGCASFLFPGLQKAVLEYQMNTNRTKEKSCVYVYVKVAYQECFHLLNLSCNDNYTHRHLVHSQRKLSHQLMFWYYQQYKPLPQFSIDSLCDLLTFGLYEDWKYQPFTQIRTPKRTISRKQSQCCQSPMSILRQFSSILHIIMSDSEHLAEKPG